MKPGVCEYGGIESIARCSGGDGGKPCGDVVYDRQRTREVSRDLERVSEQIANLSQSSPRHQALLDEQRGMENYFDVVGRD